MGLHGSIAYKQGGQNVSEPACSRWTILAAWSHGTVHINSMLKPCRQTAASGWSRTNIHARNSSQTTVNLSFFWEAEPHRVLAKNLKSHFFLWKRRTKNCLQVSKIDSWCQGWMLTFPWQETWLIGLLSWQKDWDLEAECDCWISNEDPLPWWTGPQRWPLLMPFYLAMQASVGDNYQPWP